MHGIAPAHWQKLDVPVENAVRACIDWMNVSSSSLSAAAGFRFQRADITEQSDICPALQEPISSEFVQAEFENSCFRTMTFLYLFAAN